MTRFLVILFLLVKWSAYAVDPIPSFNLPFLGNWIGQVGVDGGIPPVATVHF